MKTTFAPKTRNPHPGPLQLCTERSAPISSQLLDQCWLNPLGSTAGLIENALLGSVKQDPQRKTREPDNV